MVGNYMELIYPEFLRFKDRVAVPYTASYPISLTDRACGYGPQYERPTRSWGTRLCSSVVEQSLGKRKIVSPILTLGSFTIPLEEHRPYG